MDAGYSKNDVLRMYLADVYFGHGFYGLPAAAHGYFGVTPAQLSWSQASMLAGLVQAPSAYDPIDHLYAGRLRQRHVLNRPVATCADPWLANLIDSAVSTRCRQVHGHGHGHGHEHAGRAGPIPCDRASAMAVPPSVGGGRLGGGVAGEEEGEGCGCGASQQQPPPAGFSHRSGDGEADALSAAP
jgi:hypothetical protein